MADKDSTRVQVSVFLDRETTHKEAKIAAMTANASLTQWIEQLVLLALRKQKQKSAKRAA